jgi:hypothetical protein
VLSRRNNKLTFQNPTRISVTLYSPLKFLTFHWTVLYAYAMSQGDVQAEPHMHLLTALQGHKRIRVSCQTSNVRSVTDGSASSPEGAS